MSRNTRKAAVLLKIETTYGTDAVPAYGANEMLVSNQRIVPLKANNVDRALVRPYFGASEQLVGTRSVELSFDIEFVGSGAAGQAPRWGAALRACAMAEVVTASTRVDYTPITDSAESATIIYHDDGVNHKLLGARGDVAFKLNAGGKPIMSFTFQGLYGGIVAGSPGVADYSAFKTPLVVTDANTGDVMLGGTVASTGAPAISGGTAFPSTGLEVTLGNSVNFTALLGGESVDITGREAVGKLVVDMTPAQEVSKMADVLAATLTGVSLIHGTAAGFKTLVHMPAAQFIDPSKEELNGRRLNGYSVRATPVAGNDELRIVCF
ncbi:phage tail tube protein [Paucibacter sp. APW11]|uniref:Phage tail tube protein n=1 Tax=Roseateles aquae TaxID=3077235 RepID=A0ABU3P9E5_9BURK|nr:phage tail tube protein [Paucibacter sp. APW11]MDT8998351.1 phage tail tube protein [Paucibacter sp. APW11]